ncbi:hypothetical protein [Polaribacter cellanae]|uniref:Type II secretion system protein GspC N-terminal domain-containing protein n=1 Tax=Polaribacter cellanae TaxID=2818493 RepID=A0A975CKY9_9FLAO|nr:hypothetical protein [Polaribacter cellanae]QTE21145.1 hypothetical protein J3359_09805 [Polaribacter cellanae]
MTKQQKTYGLLIAVLIIWGIIGYQIYKRFNPEVIELSKTKVSSNFKRAKIQKNAFYEIQESYRDPFLGKFPQKKRVIKKRIVKPTVTIPFPNVVYNGIVEGGKEKSYILTVNGIQEILKKGEKVQNVVLLRANSKEAIVKFNGVRKTVKLQ